MALFSLISRLLYGDCGWLRHFHSPAGSAIVPWPPPAAVIPPKHLRGHHLHQGVSCGAGAEVQVSVAFKVNSGQNVPAEFQIYQQTIFDSLLQVTVNGPTHLDAQFLQSMWDTFENVSTSQGQVTKSLSSSHLHVRSLVSPSQLYVLFSSRPILCSPLSPGVAHLFRWSWG